MSKLTGLFLELLFVLHNIKSNVLLQFSDHFYLVGDSLPQADVFSVEIIYSIFEHMDGAFLGSQLLLDVSFLDISSFKLKDLVFQLFNTFGLLIHYLI